MRIRRLAKFWPGLVSRPSQAGQASQARLVQYNTYDAKNRFSELVRRVRRGEEIVIAHAGVPVAKLVPYRGGAGYPGVIRARLVVASEREAEPR